MDYLHTVLVVKVLGGDAGKSQHFVELMLMLRTSVSLQEKISVDCFCQSQVSILHIHLSFLSHLLDSLFLKVIGTHSFFQLMQFHVKD